MLNVTMSDEEKLKLAEEEAEYKDFLRFRQMKESAASKVSTAAASKVAEAEAPKKAKARKPAKATSSEASTGYTRKVNPKTKKISYACNGEVENNGQLAIVAPAVKDSMYHEGGKMSQVAHLEIAFDGGVVFATVCWE